MYLTKLQTLLMILSIAVGAMITRVLPFVLFPENKKIPTVVDYLGKVLPASMIGMLVVYCLRAVNVTAAPFGFPELIACVTVVVLHVWKRNNLLSIGVGTVLYMFLVQVVF